MVLKEEKYRLYVQPLTLKTEAKPVNGELIVDIEDGHIGVYNEGENIVKSATKDLFGDMDMNKYAIKMLIELANGIIARLRYLEEKYPQLKANTEELTVMFTDLASRYLGLLSSYEDVRNQTFIQAGSTLSLYERLVDFMQNLFDERYCLTELERINVEFGLLKSEHATAKTLLPSQVELTKNYYREVKELVESKVDKTTYDAWVSDYLSRVRAISPNVSFNHYA